MLKKKLENVTPNNSAKNGDSKTPIRNYYRESPPLASFPNEKARSEWNQRRSPDKNLFSAEGHTENAMEHLGKFFGLDYKKQKQLTDVRETIDSDTLQQFQTFQPFPDAYDELSKTSYSNDETDKDKYINTKDTLESDKLSSSPDKSITQEKPGNFDEKRDRQTWVATKSEEDLLLALMESTSPQSEKSLLEDSKQLEDIGLQSSINTETMAEEKKISKQDQKDSISKSPDQSKNLDKTLLEQLTKTLQDIHTDTEPKYILRTPETEKVRELASRLKKAYQTEQAIRSALDEELQLQLSESPEDSDIRKDALAMTKNKEKQKEMLKIVQESLDEMKDRKPSLLEVRKNVKIVLLYCEKTNISLEKQKFLLKLDKWINHENFDPKNLNQARQRMRAIIDKLCEESIWDHLDRSGGKAELAEAKIIYLGECHNAPIHRIYQKAIINSFANNDDIVLLEGKASYLPYHKADAEHRIGTLTKDVKVFGWDHMKAYESQGKLINKKELFSDTEYYTAYTIFNTIREAKLEETISKMRQAHPDKTIFVIAGQGHLTEYVKIAKEEHLKESIVLIPTNRPPDDELSRRRAIAFLL